jgi:hypothetical protein
VSATLFSLRPRLDRPETPEEPDVKEIRNKTPRPLRVQPPGGKTLFVGPFQTGQIADTATEHPSLRKLIEDGSIEVLGKGERATGGKTSSVSRGGPAGGPRFMRRGSGDR